MARQEELLEKILDTLKQDSRGNSAGYRSSFSSSSPISTGSSAIDAAAGKVSGFTSALGGVLNDWQIATREFGANWNNDAIGLTTSVAKARMSMEEWGNSIHAAGANFTALGGTMNESAKIFTHVATSFRDSGASEALAKMAWSTGEQNKLLAISMSTQRNLDLSKLEDQERLASSVLKMGQEMDKVTQLSGRSRQEQLAMMEKINLDARWSAHQLRSRMEGHGEGSGVAAKFMSENAGMFELAKNILVGGKMQPDNALLSNAIGQDLIQPFTIALKNLDAAKTTEEAAIRKKELDAIQAKIDERMTSSAKLKEAEQGESPVAEQTRKYLQAGNQAVLTIGNGIETTRREQSNITRAEAQRINQERAELAIASKTASGKTAAESASTEWLVKMGRATDDLAKKPIEAAAAVNARFADAVSKKNAEGLSINDKLATIDKKTGEAMSDKIYGDLGKDLTKSINNGTFIKDLGSMLEKGAVQGLSNIKSITAGTIQLMGNITGQPKFSSGTKAAFGDWFGKDFGDGTGVEVHGEEAIVPKRKLPEFLSDMQKVMGGGNQASIIENMMNSVSMTSSNLMNQMPQPTIEPVNQAPQVTQETSSGASDITLKDINEQLATLNTSMVKLISTTSDMLETTDKQYRATKQLSPNLNAR
jgi:hypothetical protein